MSKSSRRKKDKVFFGSHPQSSGKSKHTQERDLEYGSSLGELVESLMNPSPLQEFDHAASNARKLSTKTLEEKIRNDSRPNTFSGIGYASEYRSRGKDPSKINPLIPQDRQTTLKESKSLKAPQREYEKKSRWPFLLGTGAAVLGSYGLNALDNISPLAGSNKTQGEMDALVRKVRAVDPRMKNVGISFSDTIPAHLDPFGKSIVSSRNSGTLLHEIGHAQNQALYAKYLGKKAPHASTAMYAGVNKAIPIGAMGNIPILPMALAAPLLSKKLLRKVREGKDENSKIFRASKALEENPEKIMAAAASPLLMEEGSASIRALRNLARLSPKGTRAKEVLKGVGNLTPAFGTYAAATAIPIALGYAIKRSRENERRHEDAQNTLALKKTADITSTPQAHQTRVNDRLKNQSGLVVAHDMGSGKTLSSIMAMDEVGKNARGEGRQAKVRAVTPAALQKNMSKEIKKHTGKKGLSGSPDVKIQSQNVYTRDRQPLGENLDLLVVDEAHRARNVGSKYKDALRETNAKKRMLMTGTPVYNHPSDVSSLVNIASGDHLLPETKSEFEKKFIKSKKIYPKGLRGLGYRLRGGTPGIEQNLRSDDPHLRGTIGKWVDYHKPEEDSADFPTQSTETINTELSKEQRTAYKYMMNDLPPGLRYKVKMGLAPNKQEAAKLMAFLNGPRQTANSLHGFKDGMTPIQAANESPKIQALMNKVQENPTQRRVIYSNYLSSGLAPIQAALDEQGVQYGVFTGKESKRDRQNAVKAYNEGKLNTLIVSSAGGEGLDLKGTREVHVMEPHWNEQKLNQVIARARRYGSHTHLPEGERNVTVNRYLSQVPKTGPIASPMNFIRKLRGKPKKMDTSAEEYVYARSQDKQKLNDQMTGLMKSTTDAIANQKGEEKTASQQTIRQQNRRKRVANLFKPDEQALMAGAGTGWATHAMLTHDKAYKGKIAPFMLGGAALAHMANVRRRNKKLINPPKREMGALDKFPNPPRAINPPPPKKVYPQEVNKLAALPDVKSVLRNMKATSVRAAEEAIPIIAEKKPELIEAAKASIENKFKPPSKRQSLLHLKKTGRISKKQLSDGGKLMGGAVGAEIAADFIADGMRKTVGKQKEKKQTIGMKEASFEPDIQMPKVKPPKSLKPNKQSVNKKPKEMDLQQRKQMTGDKQLF